MLFAIIESHTNLPARRRAIDLKTLTLYPRHDEFDSGEAIGRSFLVAMLWNCCPD